MNRCLLVLLNFVPFLGLLPAQSNAPGKEQQERVEKRAEQMREEIDSQKTIRSHVRVQVRLKNGNRLRGVVKDGKLVERVNGLRFVQADAKDRGAGIRLWYTGGSQNYVFVPFASLSSYQILERLSAKELADIETRMRMEESRQAQERQQRAEEAERRKAEIAQSQKAEEGKKPAGGGVAGQGAPTPGGETKPGPGAEQTAEQQEQATLLKDYPPDAGWNAKKRDEIKNRLAVLGVQPSPFELRFVDVYDRWLAACKAEGIDPNAAAEPAPVGRGSKRSRK